MSKFLKIISKTPKQNKIIKKSKENFHQRGANFWNTLNIPNARVILNRQLSPTYNNYMHLDYLPLDIYFELKVAGFTYRVIQK